MDRYDYTNLFNEFINSTGETWSPDNILYNRFIDWLMDRGFSLDDAKFELTGLLVAKGVVK